MVENPGKPNELRWRVELGPDRFEQGPLQEFGGESAYKEFKALQEATKGLLAGASIPAMAMRPGPSALFPLVRYFSTLVKLISQGKTTTGTFAPFLDGPLFVVTDEWLRSWLDALAFSLSGLPASRTAAAAMAFVLSDMHRPGAMLDYPEGGMGVVVKALVRGVESGSNGSKLYVQSHVESIDCSDDAQRITGLTLKNGKRIIAREGVICNAPVWTLASLIKDKRVLKRLNNGSPPLNSKAPSTWTTTSKGATLQSQREVPLDKIEKSLLDACNTAEQTGRYDDCSTLELACQ
jgi:phytoene dehydrogenase-like protein